MKPITSAQSATIVAALRFYQSKDQASEINRSPQINDIATNCGEIIALDDTGIDDLCASIDFESFEFSMQDWRSIEESNLATEDLIEYQAKVSIGNQCHVELVNTINHNAFGFVLEINHGVPAIHMDLGGDGFLHIHAAHGGFVISPEVHSNFSNAPIDRYTDCKDRALLLSQQ
jgi:hypothetical protein